MAMALLLPLRAHPATCPASGIHVQVLGSGGPELDDDRTSSGYLIWQDGRARVLVDLGAGSLRQFERSGARIEDLDAVLLTHLHVDHSNDLPALLKAAFFSGRERDLPVYGPEGNHFMPGIRSFVHRLFAAEGGAYRYLGDYLSGGAAFRVIPHAIPVNGRDPVTAADHSTLVLSAIPVHHGPVPALAWRIELDGRAVVVSGDMNGDYATLPKLAAGADMLITHHAVPEGARGVARNLHMPPSVIGEMASRSGVSRLILSHRMRRTLGREEESEKFIRNRFSGTVTFADDGQCFPL